MIVQFKTKSGAHYTMDSENLTWERYHRTVEIHGLPNQNTFSRNVSNSGYLIEWPAIIAGHRVMFDDTRIGVIYTTEVVEATVDAD